VATAVQLPIAFVMTSFEPGGTERQMIELVRRLDTDRWTPYVACFHARGSWLGRVAQAAPISEFPIDSFRRLEAFRHGWGFAQWCRRHRIAVVHATAMPSNIFALPFAALAGVPVRIGNRREINPDKAALPIAAQRAAFACAHKVIANSRAAADRLQQEGVPRRKIEVIPNGLDVPQSSQRGAPSMLRKVVMVANLRREKGHDVLIDAAVHVLKRFPDAAFEVVGAGPELDALTSRSRAAGVSAAFTFLGHRDDVAARLDRNDIFVLPSRSEAFPNAVLEAMAAGLPIVASRVGGIPELVDHQRTGLLAPPGDSTALAEALCTLMADRELGARLGSAARAEASRYSFDRMVSAFERVYLAELARRGVIQAEEPQLVAS
jgi:glycosyltransferase involved in cell wall biosynthesis